MEYQKRPIGTIVFIAINVIVFFGLSFGGMTEDTLYMLNHGAMFLPSVVMNGEYYRFITSFFMHFGFSHLMNNMVTLGVVGYYLEPLVGSVKFSVIYLLSGLGGNVASFVYEWITGDYAVSAGASGATFGLTGALFCLTLLNRGAIAGITKQGMLFMIVLSLYNGFVSVGVDNLAHIGGLINGFLITFLLCFQSYRERRTDAWS